MEKRIVDPEFGPLMWDQHAWYSEERLELPFLGRIQTFWLCVEGEENGEFIPCQRSTWRQFKERQAEFMQRFDDALFAYFRAEIEEDWRARLDGDIPTVRSIAGLATLVTPTILVLPNLYEDEEVAIGISMECEWDPEHGAGVLILGEQVEAGGADLLTL
jgi:hypothetical protein